MESVSLGAMEVIVTLSLGVSAFFLRAFHKNVESFGEELKQAVRSINDLNKNVAIAINNQDHITKRLEKSEAEIERLWRDNSKFREVLHDTRSELAKVELNSMAIEELKRSNDA